jgi:hypothetical protein
MSHKNSDEGPLLRAIIPQLRQFSPARSPHWNVGAPGVLSAIRTEVEPRGRRKRSLRFARHPGTMRGPNRIGIGAGATEVSLHKVSVKAEGAKPRPASMWGGRVVGRRGSQLRAES